MVHCEWSIVLPEDFYYNCIAWSADLDDRWVDPIIFKNEQYWEEWWEHGVHYVSIDKKYGDGDNNFEISDLDSYYSTEKGYTPSGTGPDDARVMYYDGYHAVKRRQCECGAGQWIMYESKCGRWFVIEHVYDQLDGSDYGSRTRYYK